jgi:N-methylhydantoinase A/oxoprolinase/acetone carboxylase beta subunit
MQKTIRSHLSQKGVSLDKLPGFISVVYGGAGPTHCCGFNKGLKFAKTIISPFASPFSAFGSSMADLFHVYSKYARIKLFDGAGYCSDYHKFNSIVKDMYNGARRDIKSEGYPVEDARYYLELSLEDENSQTFIVSTDKLELTSQADVQEVSAKFTQVRERMTGQSNYQGAITISTMVLNAIITMPHWEFEAYELGPADPQPAFKGEREVFWTPGTGYQKTPIYNRDLLRPGNFVQGPAIIEAKDTTYVIPENWTLTIDKYMNAILEEV